MRIAHSRLSVPFAFAALLSTGALACASVDDLFGDMGGHPDGRLAQVTGEVRSVDTRRGHLQVRDDRTNRNHTLRYDQRTRVTYGSRQYPASSLERGDYVSVRVSYDRSGNAWADRVDVRSGARDSRNVAGRVQRVDGTVRTVDARRGYFTLDQNRGSLVVYVPRGIRSSDARRFERLRRGERVRLEVRALRSNQAELVRFR
jgi:hypothetical protein